MNYLLQFVRSQKARKILSFTSILGLTICTASALLLLMYIRFVLSYDSFHDADHTYRVESRLYDNEVLSDNWATTTFGHGPVMKQEIPGIEEFVRVTTQDKEQTVTYKDKMFIEKRYCYTEPSFFNIFNFVLIEGDQSNQLIRPNTIVINQTTANRYFGDESPIGKTLTFKTATSSKHFEVTGIIKDMPTNSLLKYDFLLSFSTIPQERQNIWYIHGVYTYIRLASDKKKDEIEYTFAKISDQYKTTALKHKTWKIELIPLKEIYLNPQKGYEKETKGSRSAIYILSIMAIALLLIGWINALNITVAQHLERGKEIGIRKAFGATQLQTLFQGIFEAGLLNLQALIMATLLLVLLTPLVNSFTNIPLNISSTSNLWLILIIFIVGTFFIGLYPAILRIRIHPINIMRGRLIHGKQGNNLRKSLIVGQFITSFILISGTLVIIQQVNYMQQNNETEVKDNMLVIKYPSYIEDMQARVESFTKQLKQHSQINEVSISGAIPGVEVANYFTNRRLNDASEETKLIQMFSVDYYYINAYQQKLVCGRSFSDAFGMEKYNIILNEEAVRLLGYTSNEQALGEKLVMEVVDKPLEIIGVVQNYHQESLSTNYKPIIFFISELIPFIPTPYISVCAKEKLNESIAYDIEQTYSSFFPTSLFSSFTLGDLLSNQYYEEINFSYFFAIASLLAVTVACMGLWVISLFSMLSRKKEIGIRKVLGTSNIQLFFELAKEFIALVLLASLAGTPLSIWIMNRWLSTYAFHISIEWWIFPLTFIALMLVTIATISLQIRKSIRRPPIESLKNE